MATASSTSAIPEGMSKTDFRHWKAEQTARAKERLHELEERLQRLQLLDSKMRKLRASSTDVESSANNSMHGAMDFSSLSANPYSQPPTAGGAYDAANALMSVVGGDVPRGLPVGRPVTPGTIRRIIRSRPSQTHTGCVQHSPIVNVHTPTVSDTPPSVADTDTNRIVLAGRRCRA